MSDIELRDACLSYRHDFGLMLECEQDDLIYQAKEWSRCLRVDELKSQLASRLKECQDMETKLHNECQSHERMKAQLTAANARLSASEVILSQAGEDLASVTATIAEQDAYRVKGNAKIAEMGIKIAELQGQMLAMRNCYNCGRSDIDCNMDYRERRNNNLKYWEAKR